MSPQSHEDVIREFAKLAGNLRQPDKATKRKLIAKTVGVEVGKLAAAITGVLVLSMAGWVALTTLHEVGVLAWNPTLWQGVRLIAPVLLLIVAVPFTIHVRQKK